MKERSVKILALACSIAGLIILYFSSVMAEQSAQPVAVGTIGMDDVGTTVKVCGNVSGLKTSNGHKFFGLDDATGSVRTVIFNTTSSPNITEGSSVCLIGQIQEYPPGSGETELVTRRLQSSPVVA